jgi:hypothetical protein
MAQHALVSSGPSSASSEWHPAPAETSSLISDVFVGVAYATPESGELPFEEIDLVNDWGPNMGNHYKIPSVISFSLSTEHGEQQWGCDLSENAVAMVHTKLELDPQTVSFELDLLLESLDGMKNLDFEQLKRVGARPAYTTKSAEQIVTEYLSRVFNHLTEYVEDLRVYKDRVPVDIVVTIPTVCYLVGRNWNFLQCSYSSKHAGLELHSEECDISGCHERWLQREVLSSTSRRPVRHRAGSGSSVHGQISEGDRQ